MVSILKNVNYAYKNKFSYAVMIHGDGQYDPKYSSIMIENLIKNKNLSATVGSRMYKKVNALKGKMPLYKFVGNIFLTKYLIFYIELTLQIVIQVIGLQFKFNKENTFDDLDNNFVSILI